MAIYKLAVDIHSVSFPSHSFLLSHLILAPPSPYVFLLSPPCQDYMTLKDRVNIPYTSYYYNSHSHPVNDQ